LETDFLSIFCQADELDSSLSFDQHYLRDNLYNMSSFTKFTKSSLVTQITESTFQQEVLESEVPVLVDFWSSRCKSCRLLEPVIDNLARQYTSIVKVVKVNTDENPSLARQHGIRNLPTLMIFNDAQKVEMIVGAVPITTLSKALENYI
jgi:thioredoxin 1